MERKDIKGFTLKLFRHYIEFVFVNYFLRVIAISDPFRNTIKRFEW